MGPLDDWSLFILSALAMATIICACAYATFTSTNNLRRTRWDVFGGEVVRVSESPSGMTSTIDMAVCWKYMGTGRRDRGQGRGDGGPWESFYFRHWQSHRCPSSSALPTPTPRSHPSTPTSPPPTTRAPNSPRSCRPGRPAGRTRGTVLRRARAAHLQINAVKAPTEDLSAELREAQNIVADLEREMDGLREELSRSGEDDATARAERDRDGARARADQEAQTAARFHDQADEARLALAARDAAVSSLEWTLATAK
ncbi:hypothetical protein HDU93_004263 [Gonapodya sp. JEL0774]|nr:hypothetical protein HDU93_004263 [Gonapodya sp. JEL0774]